MVRQVAGAAITQRCGKEIAGSVCTVAAICDHEFPLIGALVSMFVTEWIFPDSATLHPGYG
jgi:hypothetical protein